MTAPLIRLHIHDHAGTVILNRAEKRNALNRAMLGELQEALGDLHLERRVRAVILTGAGPAFCAGMDLQEMLDTSREENARQRWQDDADLYRDLLELLWRFPKPLIAAVNGPALAGGAGLVLGCDIVIASREAKFGLPEPRRGIVAGLVAPLLAFRLGGGQAARLLLSAETIDASEAHRIGLFHELAEPDQLWPRAVAMAAECARSSSEALQLTKRLLNEMVAEHLPTLLTAGAAVSATARTTDAAAEGLAAFLEKREPKWQ
ncbi:MAG: enoyl-CoA hydratase [Planctomycetia bacterium 21-64-5]|nr:MAG: enoyl-CoA hydratase [Planctomycetia bacterium 21-64-5]HQU43584.1 enoyl-CoA hydratase/isomerase family protein [Pirellulales bacterium]